MAEDTPAEETWHRLRELFDGAVEREGDERRAYLDAARTADPELCRAVESLIAAELEIEGFLDPLVEGPDGPTRVAQPPPGEPEPAEVPPRLGPYRILRRLGQGGMGVVYLAVRDDDAFERQVVVKLARHDRGDAGLLRRLRTERHILAGLDHPNIARLYDGGTTADRRPYFVMEYVEGTPIDRFCDHHELSLDERLELFRKICDAVHYAHQNLVIHRDLKPSNILVTADGEPKLLDFGIAKLINPGMSARTVEATETGSHLMTPQYASPEQIRGKLVTTASDVYSLGVLLFKLLTGRYPYRLENLSPREMEKVVTEREPPRPSTVVATDAGGTGERLVDIARHRGLRPRELGRRLAGDLDAIVLRALRSAPRKRYASAERLSADIERYRRRLPVEARRGTLRYRASRLLYRHRVSFAVGALVSVLLVLFVVTTLRQASRVAFERDQARQERQRRETVHELLLDLLKVADPYVANGAELTVREALEQSQEVLEIRLRNEPQLRAELLHTTGKIYFNLGLWQAGRTDLVEALDLRRGLFGDEHRDVATTRAALGLVLAELGQADEARRLSGAALATARARGESPDGESDQDLLSVLNSHVTVLCLAEAYSEAGPFADEAVERARRRPERDLDELAVALFNRGIIALKGDDPVAAAELFRQSVRVFEQLHGDDHLVLATPLNNLGSSLRRSGDLEGAEAAFQRAFDLRARVAGEEHPELLPMLNNLASLRLERGDAAGAVELWRRGLAILREAAGPEHHRVLFLELQIAEARIEQGEAVEVLAELRRSLPEWRGRLGDEHSYLSKGDRAIARALIALGRLGEARDLLTASAERLRVRGAARDLDRAGELLEEVERLTSR